MRSSLAISSAETPLSHVVAKVRGIEIRSLSVTDEAFDRRGEFVDRVGHHIGQTRRQTPRTRISETSALLFSGVLRVESAASVRWGSNLAVDGCLIHIRQDSPVQFRKLGSLQWKETWFTEFDGFS